MKLLIAFFTLISLSFFSIAEDKNILFIGNSFTHYNDMPKYFDSICVFEHKEVNVGMFAKSNHTLNMHSKREDLYHTIEREKWDVVIIQGFSREFAQPDSVIIKETIPYFDRIYSAIMENNPETKVFLYMTWGYKYGYKNQKWNNSQKKMLKNIRHGYQLIADEYNLPVIPVGEVWYNVFNKKKLNLYQKDNHHPNKYGSILVASSVYVGLFNQSLHPYDFDGMNTENLKKIRKSTNAFFRKYSTFYGLERLQKSKVNSTYSANELSLYQPKVDVLVYQYMNNTIKQYLIFKDYSKMAIAKNNNRRDNIPEYHIVFIAPNRRKGDLLNKE